MATPVTDTYTTTSGTTIYAGRFFYPPMYGDIVVAGDSITDLAYTSGLYRGQLPHLRSPYRLIANAGITNNTLDDLWNRWSTDVIAPNPKIVWLRIGTNSITSDISGFITKYRRFTDSCQANSMFCVVCAIPPRRGSAVVIKDINAALAVLCNSYSDRSIRYLDDGYPLAIDTDYNINEAMYIDGIHPNATGQYVVGVGTKTLAADLFLPNDPRITDPSDTYYLTPSSGQYVKNPFMQGTGGTKYYVTGTVPDFWGMGCNGSGTTAIATIQAADVGDTNQTPWVVCDLATIGAGGHSFGVSATLEHPALAADLTVKRFDTMCELKLINLDTSKVGSFTFKVSRNDVTAGAAETMSLGNGILNDTVLLRSSYPRNHRGTTLVAFPANTLMFGVSLSTTAASTTSAGKFAIRLASVRGQAT